MKIGRLDALIVIIVVMIIVALTAAEQGLPAQYAAEVDLAVDALTDADVAPRETNGWVTLQLNRKSYSVPNLVRSLPRSLDRHPVPVIANLGPQRSAVGLARGVDRNYHVWQSFLQSYVPFATDNIWLPLLVLANRKRYAFDHDVYRLGSDGDIWQTSREAFSLPRGDCEDHAILLADWLIGLGENARVAVGTMSGGGHAWVVLFRDGKEYVLEATQKHGVAGLKSWPLARTKPEYQPRFQFNREHFWVNTRAAATVRYRDERWELRSSFRSSSRSSSRS
ncbi:MAG: hypothetical protein AB8B93_03980 [Pseudomonadales bacterium]